MTRQKPSIFVVDDDRSVLQAISRLLRASGFNVATFDSPESFLARHDCTVHGCILLDVAMPGLDGLQLQEALAARGASLPIIFLSGHGDIPISVRAMKRGAIDFLTKPVDESELLKAIQAALASDRATRKARAEAAEIHRRLAKLTPREHEVFEHVISGWLNKQTAAELGTAEKTVKTHRARVMAKMQVHSVAELVHLAERVGITGAMLATLDRSANHICPIV